MGLGGWCKPFICFSDISPNQAKHLLTFFFLGLLGGWGVKDATCFPEQQHNCANDQTCVCEERLKGIRGRAWSLQQDRAAARTWLTCPHQSILARAQTSLQNPCCSLTWPRLRVEGKPLSQPGFCPVHNLEVPREITELTARSEWFRKGDQGSNQTVTN